MVFLDRSTWEGRIYSQGWTAGSGGEYDAIEPATGNVLARVGAATAADVDKAAELAAQAQLEWAAMTYDRRAAVLRQAGDLFVEHEDEIHDWLIRESGAIRPFAQFQTRGVAAEECWEAAALASHPIGEILRSNQPRLSLARRRPVGVVGVIAPFNAPIILAIRAIAPALALGNAVICKPDPRTAICGGVVFARIFEEAGLPAGLLPDAARWCRCRRRGRREPADPGHRLHRLDPRRKDHRGRRRAAAQARAPGVGRQLRADRAGRRRRRESRLGRRFRLFQPQPVRSAWRPAGTWSPNRSPTNTPPHWPSTPTASRSVTPLGDDVGMGPIIDAKQRDNVHRIVTASVEQGATLAAGGTYEGLFYRPTVLTDVPLTAPAYAEEIFGPVAPVVAVRRPGRGGPAGQWHRVRPVAGHSHRDVMKGLALAERIPSGLVHINDQTVNDEALIPFGGVGESGTGSRHGGTAANLDAFTDVQWVTMRGDLPQYPF